MINFERILSNISAAEFSNEPFRHIYIENFFEAEDFENIVSAPEIRLEKFNCDDELIAELYRHNYKEIPFPGTTTDVQTYLDWHKTRNRQAGINKATCEGFGITFRLTKSESGSILSKCSEFFTSDRFWDTLKRKFALERFDVRHDFGLQKYLDGYEISPHPDIRQKALTFMININPSPNSENLDFHTHYMRFTPERDYIREGWRSNKQKDREWIEWSWAQTIKKQTRNNSIVIFAPSDDTLHAVRASYNHLLTQRTQFYGNLWHKTNPVESAIQASAAY
jgi:hypothetical protein